MLLGYCVCELNDAREKERRLVRLRVKDDRLGREKVVVPALATAKYTFTGNWEKCHFSRENCGARVLSELNAGRTLSQRGLTIKLLANGASWERKQKTSLPPAQTMGCSQWMNEWIEKWMNANTTACMPLIAVVPWRWGREQRAIRRSCSNNSSIENGSAPGEHGGQGKVKVCTYCTHTHSVSLALKAYYKIQ